MAFVDAEAPVSEVTAEQKALAHTSFMEFIKLIYGWEPRAHQKRWIEALEYLGRDILRRRDTAECENCDGLRGCSPEHRTTLLLILAPPFSGKTMTVMEWVAWMIARSASIGEIPRGGYVCYAEDVAVKRSVAIRDVLDSSTFRAVFPAVVPDKARGWSHGEWYLVRKDQSLPYPTLEGRGIRGSIISNRWPTFIVVDDPHSAYDLGLSTKNETQRVWDDGIRTRGEYAPKVVISTRWAEDDLVGRIMRSEPNCAILHLQALDENEETYWPREKGPHGEDMGIDTIDLLEMRKSRNRTFITQFQALPPSAESDTFKVIRQVPTWPRRDEVVAIYQAWDTAQTAKAKKRGSYTVMVEGLKLENGRVFISRVIRERMGPVAVFEKMTEAWMEANEKWGIVPLVLVENKSSGPSLVSFQQVYGAIGPHIMTVDIPGALGRRGQGDLVQRAAPAAQIFETGSVVLPLDWEPWYDEYIREMSAFPDSEYFDQVAATLILTEHAFPLVAGGAPPNLRIRLPGYN